MTTTVDNLSDAILKELENYSELVTEGIKKSVDIVAKECDAVIKEHITFDEPTGKYVKAFKIKKVTDSQFNRSRTWYVSGSQYRLTHLLEKGHATRNGGRTKAYKHIEYGEELVIKRMQELSREVIENAGH
ncbi:hypothetical protein [Clostridium estertheticum]|uniref:HK97 gp10 family phage protein n=1 Tax=Clostridium estertheticum TaxID=238834 RepID=A0AA47ELP9_9CLOT|nr:hypothetical protein [Clostridium estertheticum]MBU3153501.1 hypothetical protein [Clostridium estertheticum]WAG60903.1 hypothetical protein LL038_01225 [Clostridium estertheticum]